MPATSRSLLDYLQPMVQEVVRRSRVVLRLVQSRYSYTGEIDTGVEQVDALSCLFEAYLSLGGKVDAPERFRWKAQEEALTKQAVLEFQRLLRGTGTPVYDRILRWGFRREPAFIWDSWGTESLEGCSSGLREQARDSAAPDAPPVLRGAAVWQKSSDVRDAPQDVMLQRRILMELCVDLEAALPRRYYFLLRMHYLSGMSVAEIARKLRVQESQIHRTLSRARAAARERLPERWRSVYADLHV